MKKKKYEHGYHGSNPKQKSKYVFDEKENDNHDLESSISTPISTGITLAKNQNNSQIGSSLLAETGNSRAQKSASAKNKITSRPQIFLAMHLTRIMLLSTSMNMRGFQEKNVGREEMVRKCFCYNIIFQKIKT